VIIRLRSGRATLIRFWGYLQFLGRLLTGKDGCEPTSVFRPDRGHWPHGHRSQSSTRAWIGHQLLVSRSSRRSEAPV